VCVCVWDLNVHHAEQAHRNHESLRPPNPTKKSVGKTWKRTGKLGLEAFKALGWHVLTELWWFVFGFAPIWIRFEEFQPLWECVWLVWAVPTCIQRTRVWSETGF